MTSSAENISNSVSVTAEIIQHWQNLMDVIGQELNVPCACIMKLNRDELEVFSVCQTGRSFYRQGQKFPLTNSLDGHVLTLRERLCVADTSQSTKWKDVLLLHPKLCYYLGYPLLWPNGDLFGTISVQDTQKNTIADSKDGLLAEFRHLVEQDLLILQLQKALRLETERRKRVESELVNFTPKEFHSLMHAAHAVLMHRKFDISARIIFDEACKMTGATAGYVALLDDTGKENEVLFLEAGGLPCTVDPNLPMPIRGLRAESYNSGKAVYDNDFMQSQWTAYLPAGHVDMRNVMFAPLNINDKTVGIIGLANKDGDFTEFDVSMAEAFGEIAAIALRNSRTLDELDETNQKLEHFNETLVNREMRIIEVKQEVNALCRELGRDSVYRVGKGG
ncbi:MAG: GAF domain-containing protein [Candidatus Electrothrix sp. AUS4]|nr:GAF domain-containing protein [Candidatus Electrothrix sp. AUS4]